MKSENFMLTGIVFQTLLQQLFQDYTRYYPSEQKSLVVISNAYKWCHKGTKRNATLRSMTSFSNILRHFRSLALAALFKT